MRQHVCPPTAKGLRRILAAAAASCRNKHTPCLQTLLGKRAAASCILALKTDSNCRSTVAQLCSSRHAEVSTGLCHNTSHCERCSATSLAWQRNRRIKRLRHDWYLRHLCKELCSFKASSGNLQMHKWHICQILRLPHAQLR